MRHDCVQMVDGCLKQVSTRTSGKVDHILVVGKLIAHSITLPYGQMKYEFYQAKFVKLDYKDIKSNIQDYEKILYAKNLALDVSLIPKKFIDHWKDITKSVMREVRRSSDRERT